MNVDKIINQIFKTVFDINPSLTKEEVLKDFAFDVKLPQKVYDSTTNEETWAISVNPTKFITNDNQDKIGNEKGWMLEKKNVSSLEEILEIWKSINYTTTERVYNSINVLESDTVYNSENVFRSSNLSGCKNAIYSDGTQNSEYIIASSRSNHLAYCIRVDDSTNCTNSYNVICSGKITNSMFIQNCSNLYECIFCSHIANKRYCIANMQFEKEEYYFLKKEITKWILEKK